MLVTAPTSRWHTQVHRTEAPGLGIQAKGTWRKIQSPGSRHRADGAGVLRVLGTRSRGKTAALQAHPWVFRSEEARVETLRSEGQGYR